MSKKSFSTDYISLLLFSMFCFVISGISLARVESVPVSVEQDRPNSPVLNPSIYHGVMLHSGEFILPEVDLHIPGRGLDFVFKRTYRSQVIYSGVLGWGWDHNYNRRVLELPNGDYLYYDGTGRRERYPAQKNNKGQIIGYTAPNGYFTQAKKYTDGRFRVLHPNRLLETFDNRGRLICLNDSNWNKLEFTYNMNGQLSTVQDTMGRLIHFTYYPFLDAEGNRAITWISGRLKSITDFTGRTVTYTYDENSGDLIAVDFHERSKQYTYSTHTDLSLAHNLLTATDAKGQEVLNITYAGDKVTSFILGKDKISFPVVGATAEVIDGNNKKSTYTHDVEGHPLSITMNGQSTHFEYLYKDGYNEGLIEKITYPMGNAVEYTYDIGNENRRSQANILQIKKIPGTRGGEVQTTMLSYENDTNQLTQITEPLGNTTQYTIATLSGNLEQVIRPDGKTTTYTYNTFGQLETVTDPLQKLTRYTYYPESAPYGNGEGTPGTHTLNTATGGHLKSIILDPGGDNISQTFVYDHYGNITIETDGEGGKTIYEYNDTPFSELKNIIRGTAGVDGQPAVNLVTHFIAYDKNGNLLSAVENGITTSYTYDILDRVTSITRSAGDLTQTYDYTYDGVGNIIQVTYPKGNTDSFEYDEANRLWKEYRGNKTTSIVYAYDNNGNTISLFDGENKEYRYIYDGHDRLQEILDPLNNKIKYTYDKNSNLTSIKGLGINGEQMNMEYTYDPLDRPTKISLLAGNTPIDTQYSYDAASRLKAITTPNKNTYHITRTGSGLPAITTDPMGNKDHHGYDRRGWRKHITETEAGGKSLTTNFQYTVLGNPAGHSDSLDRKYRYFYNPKHQLDATQDPGGGVITYQYDALGRQTKSIRHIEYKGEVKKYETLYAYDLNDNLTSITDPEGNITSYAYDNKDRLIKITYPGNQTESVTYNGRDQVITYKALNGTTITHTYDAAGRLTRNDITPGGTTSGTTFYETFSYDGLGRLTSATNENSIVGLLYDAVGRVTQETTTWKHDDAGQQIVDKSYTVKKEYDTDGNVTQIIYPSGKQLDIAYDSLDRIDTVTSSGKLLVSYTYEGKAKVIGKKYQDTVKAMTSYDDGRRPVSETQLQLPDNQIIDTHNMTWSKAGLKLSDEDREEKQELAYDTAQRLRQQTGREKDTNQINTETTYTIDGVENIEEKQKTSAGVTETTPYKHNEKHQVIEANGEPLTYDGNGNLTKYNNYTYTYDWKNRLKTVSTGTGTKIEYFYDVIGRRIQQVTTDPDKSDTRYFVYNGWRVIEEIDGNDNLRSRYAYGNSIDERVEIEKASSPLVSYIPLYNNIGSVTALLDTSGKIIEKVKYTTYGKPAFIYDDTAPQVDVVRTSSASIAIRFSEPVNKESSQDAIIIKQGTKEVSGTLTFSDDDRLANFTPGEPLPQGSSLSLQITTNLQDNFNNTLTGEFSQDFNYSGTDAVIYDRANPEVESIKLVKGQFQIALTEEIATSSLTGSVETTRDTETISGTISPLDAKTIKFTPNETLTRGSHYTFRVKAPLSDISGKSVVEYEQDFTYMGGDRLLFERASESEHTVSKVKNQYLFQGRPYDATSGLYYYRARYFHPELGRFLQADPMGYKDSLNLYQGMNMNPVNFLDPMGAWKRKGDWSPGKAYVKREKGDTLQKLALLITGDPADSFLITEKNGKKIDVTPLIIRFSNRVRKNIANVAKNANNNLRLSFSPLHMETSRNLRIANESKINSLFSENTMIEESDCSLAALIIRAKGVIDSMNPGEFEALGLEAATIPILDLNQNKDGDWIPQDYDINNVELGDQIHLKNKEDYVKNFQHAGMEGEHVIKVGDDLYYGFGHDESIKSYEEWREVLASSYNILITEENMIPKISKNDVVGYWGFRIRIDYFMLSQMIFDLRSKKEK